MCVFKKTGTPAVCFACGIIRLFFYICLTKVRRIRQIPLVKGSLSLILSMSSLFFSFLTYSLTNWRQGGVSMATVSTPLSASKARLRLNSQPTFLFLPFHSPPSPSTTSPLSASRGCRSDESGNTVQHTLPVGNEHMKNGGITETQNSKKNLAQYIM